MNRKSICAVVVTYNRKDALLQCLNALKKQTYALDHIIVVNNASTDGTIDFLQQHQWQNNDFFQLLTLAENEGGAGGFYQGIKSAYEQGFDYIWLMDDDGLPAKDCLSNLLPYIKENNYIGPLVLDIKEPDSLCFPIRIPNTLNRINSLSELSKFKIQKKIDGIVIPFNGILFSSKIVSTVGLPKKEYFIWGDDMEYTLRMKKHSIEIMSIVNARFYHPKELSLGSSMLFGKLHFNDTDSKLKLYCMCRNAIHNHLLYNSNKHILGFIFKTLWFYLFSKPNKNKLIIAIRGIYHGLKRDFTHHKEYLK